MTDFIEIASYNETHYFVSTEQDITDNMHGVVHIIGEYIHYVEGDTSLPQVQADMGAAYDNAPIVYKD